MVRAHVQYSGRGAGRLGKRGDVHPGTLLHSIALLLQPPSHAATSHKAVGQHRARRRAIVSPPERLPAGPSHLQDHMSLRFKLPSS